MATEAVSAAKNRGVLFAQVYINSILDKLKDTDAAGFLETLWEWFAKADRSSLAGFVSSLIGPVLDVHGFIRGELSGNTILLFEDRNRSKLMSVCYVVDSAESLDQTVKGKNYAVSLIKELKKAGLRWGILTNGNSWRLYYTKEKAVFEIYFQINLEKVVENKDKLETALFTQFFCSQSFLLDEKNECPLDAFRQESEEATKEIEEHLQTKMEDILGKICMGFIKSEGKQSYTEEEKRSVFNNSIYFLYRLLFVLYAEARGFLPINNPEYFEKSMSKIMLSVNESHRAGTSDTSKRTLWNTLSEVFDWINQGNHALGISPYNGGLFNNSEKQYLAEHSITDAYLSEALFSLGFRESKDKLIPIDYDDLSVRHLGGLYEGILEYKLYIAYERIIRRNEKDAFKFIPESHAGKITKSDAIIEKGDVYFAQTSDERKITGSFYTPEEIVRHIVEYSLGKCIEDYRKDLTTILSPLISEYEIAVDDKERDRLAKYIDDRIVCFVEEKILSLRVLDPAMGSGHFLVNASYFITNSIIEFLHSTDWANECINTNPLFWRRQVVEKCIFGVDLNELSTELTKLSLWLISADSRKPLTFLDHHLRTGNSLLGTKLLDLKTLPRELSEKSKQDQTTIDYQLLKNELVPKMLKSFIEMEKNSDELVDIEKKKECFEEWVRVKQNIQRVANIWLATFFGFKIDEKEYYNFLFDAFNGKCVPVDKRVEEIAGQSLNNFFHWWLEFPEAFLDSKRIGFDVVIGNPPWGSKMPNNVNKIMAKKWGLPEGNINSCMLFMLEGLEKLSDRGYFGFLLPKVIIKNEAYYPIRKKLIDDYHFDRISDFGQFPGVAADAVSIILSQKSHSNSNTEILFFKNFRIIRENSLCQSFFSKNTSYIISLSLTPEIQYLLEKIRHDSTNLGHLFKIKRGIELGQKSLIVKCGKCRSWNEANTKYYGKSEKICKKCGSKLDNQKDETMLISSLGCVYPFVKKCISGTQLHRYNILESYFIPENLRGIDYKEGAFASPKILVKRISTQIEAAFSSDQLLAFNTVYSVYNPNLDRNRYLCVLGIVNSELLRFFYEYSYNIGMNLTTQVTTQFLSQLPIKLGTVFQQVSLVEKVEMMLSCKQSERNNINGTVTAVKYDIQQNEASIDAIVYEIYGLSKAEVNLIKEAIN